MPGRFVFRLTPDGSSTLGEVGRWTNDGRLGIGSTFGTLAATTALTIQGTTATTSRADLKRVGADAGAPGIAFLKARGAAIGSETATNANDGLGNVLFGGHDGTSYQFSSGLIQAFAGSLWSGTNRETYLSFSNTPSGSTTAAERFRIGSAGQWGIAGATYGAALDVFTSGGASAAPTWTAPGALTKVDDTNVTLTLGGTPTTALLRAASLTLGWTGTLGVARGGTNISSYAVGDLLYASGATTLSKLADVAAGSYLRSGGVTTAPLWSTLILPNAATANRIAYATASNTWGESADLAFDGTDFLLGSSIRARMSGQNRFRYLNSMAKATNSSNTTVSTSTITIINWDTDEYDTDTIHDTGANTSRFTAKIAGKYLIECNLRYDTPGSSTGSVHVGWRLNGNSGSDKNIAAIPNSSSAVLLMVNAAIPVNLAANDYVEFWAFQNLGSNMTVNLNDSFGAITYIGE